MYDILDYVIIPYSLSFFVYWFLCLIFFILDKNINTKYRIEYNIDWKLYQKTVSHGIYLQFAVCVPVMYFMIPLWKFRGINMYFNDISYIDFIKLIFNGLLGESIFYYLHYLSHFIFYSKIHKIHHEWKNTCAVAAAYAHPLEYLFISLPSFLLPPIITGSNWFITNLWFIIATISVVIDHSGYKIFTSEYHWKHHKYSNTNYGMNILGNFIINLFYKK